MTLTTFFLPLVFFFYFFCFFFHFGQQIFDNLEIFQSWFGFSNIGGAAGTTSSEIVAEEANQKVVTKLHEILRPFLLRRLKKDVLADMPPKKEVVVYTPMSSLQRDYYTMAYEGTLREKLLGMGLSGGRDCSQININMNLRKVNPHEGLKPRPFSHVSLVSAPPGSSHFLSLFFFSPVFPSFVPLTPRNRSRTTPFCLASPTTKRASRFATRGLSCW